MKSQKEECENQKKEEKKDKKKIKAGDHSSNDLISVALIFQLNPTFILQL